MDTETITTEVDGQPSTIVLDGTIPRPEPLVASASLDDAMGDVAAAQDAFQRAKARAKDAAEAKKEAQEELNAAIERAVRIYRNEHGDCAQLPLTKIAQDEADAGEAEDNDDPDGGSGDTDYDGDNHGVTA